MSLENIRKYFVPGKDYPHKDKFAEQLRCCLEMSGCDWLQELQESYNPWPADCVERMADEIATLREQVDRAWAEYEVQHDANHKLLDDLADENERATELAAIVNGYYESHYQASDPQPCPCEPCRLSRNEKANATCPGSGEAIMAKARRDAAGKGGVAAIIGKCPGDETDDEIAAMLKDDVDTFAKDLTDAGLDEQVIEGASRHFTEDKIVPRSAPLTDADAKALADDDTESEQHKSICSKQHDPISECPVCRPKESEAKDG